MKLTPLPMIHGADAHDKFHQAMQRISRDSSTPTDKRLALGTKHPDRFAESTSLPEYADEYDIPKIIRQHRKDSRVAVRLVWMLAICAVIGLLKWKFGF
jgi:hypothetical protein